MPFTHRSMLLTLLLLLPLSLAAQQPVEQPTDTESSDLTTEQPMAPAAPATGTFANTGADMAEGATGEVDNNASEPESAAASAPQPVVENPIDSANTPAPPTAAESGEPTAKVELEPVAPTPAASADSSADTDDLGTNPGDLGSPIPDQLRLPGDPTLVEPTLVEPGPAQPASAFGVIDPNRLNAFLDGLVEASMLQYHLPGVVVAVVEADQLISSRGWGYADLEQRRLASPADSLFRVGSISKVVTATAVMQLQERAQLALDQPIGRYLDPPPFADAEAVKLSHLLNHQAGFEDGYLGHFVADDAASDYTLEDYVNRFPPARVRAAGELSSYSNYGWAVLGEVIAKVSGSPYEDYMDALLTSLGMQHSSFREMPPGAGATGIPERADSLPLSLANQRAQGYRYSAGQQHPNSRWWMHRGMAPAGALSATADDMARFMRFQLNLGQIDGRQVLRRDTIEQMHEELSRHHPAVGGNAHGFWTNELSGLKTLEHGGAIFNFYSNLVLIPEANIGIFVSTNGADGRQFTQDLPRLIVEQFLASRAPVQPTPEGFADRAAALTGVYRSTRRNYSKVEAAGTLFEADARVSVIEPDRLLVTGYGEPQTYTEREPGVFVSQRDGRSIAFSATTDGPAQRLYTNYGHVVLERVPWYARTELFWGVFGSLLALSVLRVLGLRFRKPQAAGPASHTAAVVGWLAAIGWLSFAVGLYLVFSATAEAESALVVHFPNAMAIWSLGIGLAAAALSVLGALLTPWVIGGDWPWWRRWHFFLFSLAAVLSLPLLWYWRLLGYHLYGTTSVLLPPLIGG